MDSSTRAELIRKGNEAFNNRDFYKARDLFEKADYKSGLIRIGDYYMYDRSLPLLAYGYYKKANATGKIEDLHRRMILAIGKWVGMDKLKEGSRIMLSAGNSRPAASPSAAQPGPGISTDNEGLISVPIDPSLREAALKILEKKQ